MSPYVYFMNYNMICCNLLIHTHYNMLVTAVRILGIEIDDTSKCTLYEYCTIVELFPTVISGFQNSASAVHAAAAGESERNGRRRRHWGRRLGPGADDPHGGPERPALRLAAAHLPPLLSHPEALPTELSQEPGVSIIRNIWCLSPLILIICTRLYSTREANFLDYL